MDFIISAGSSIGVISAGRETLREAVELAMQYREQGLPNIKIKNLIDDSVMNENEIVALASSGRWLEDNA